MNLFRIAYAFSKLSNDILSLDSSFERIKAVSGFLTTRPSDGLSAIGFMTGG